MEDECNILIMESLSHHIYCIILKFLRKIMIITKDELAQMHTIYLQEVSPKFG